MMDDPADTGASKGKAQDPPHYTNGFKPRDDMTAVQPPRQEDMQRSYAAIVAEDVNPKGWYGSMSSSPPPGRRFGLDPMRTQSLRFCSRRANV